MCCVLDVVGQPHTTFDKTILSSSRFLESYFVNMLFIIFGRCVYLSQSVPLIFPVTQVAILTHLWYILPHKGSIKRSQLSLRQEPIPFHYTCDFTIYPQFTFSVCGIYTTCQDHIKISFSVVAEVTRVSKLKASFPWQIQVWSVVTSCTAESSRSLTSMWFLLPLALPAIVAGQILSRI